METYLGDAEISSQKPSRRRSKCESYFQAELCSLAFGATIEERLNHIASYCAVELGDKMWASKRGDCERMVFGRAGREGVADDFDVDDERHVRAMAGLITLTLSQRSVVQSLKEHAALKEFIASYEGKYGPDAKFRMRADIFFDALGGKLKYPTFCTFAAVLSKLGESPYKGASYFEVQRRALGYKSKEIMRLEMGNRADKAQPLKLHQISHQLVKTLPGRGLLVRARVNRRHTVYSVKLSQEHLEASLLKRARDKGSLSRVRRDVELMARLKQETNKKPGPERCRPDGILKDASPQPLKVFTGACADVPSKVFTIIEPELEPSTKTL